MSDETPLIPDQRRELLVAHLQRERVLSVHQLVELLGVSHMTIRRDIAALETQGRVQSVPGGVRLGGHLRAEPSRVDKSLVDRDQKSAIAERAAAELLADHMTVYLDAGTTIAQLVPHVTAHTGMTVVTNDFAIADALLDAPDVEVIHVGGSLDRGNRSSVGVLATAILERITLDLALISSSSWDLRHGITTPYPEKVGVKQAAMAVAAESALLAGSSKYGRYGMYKVCALSDLSAVITDTGLPAEAAAEIRAAGVKLTTA